ncbi:MAG: helix-turn-helix transcriptional regulator [Proteiniphilum sp.]
MTESKPVYGELMETLQRERRALGLRNYDVAYKSGISVENVRNLLNGTQEPKLETMHRLASALGYRIVLERKDK